MPLPVTALYAALLCSVGLVLQNLVGRERLRAGISLGDAGDPRLAEAMRRQANFVEQVPLALLLLAVIESNGASAAWLHGLGFSLFVCRVVHPFGVNARDMRVRARFVGAFGTLLVMLAEVSIAGWQGLAG